jgi:surfactin synthase thioesterase subunit
MGSTTWAPAATGPPALRLFCFHHAGGSPSSFLGWRGRFGPRVEVAPLRFAGHSSNWGANHGANRGDSQGADLAQAAAALNDAIGRHDDLPFAFYGHSMGALVAHRVTKLRAALGLPAPLLLAVGACAAPDRPGPIAALARLPDDELLAVLARVGDWTRPTHSSPQWAAVALARVRADLDLWAGDQAHELSATATAITAIATATAAITPVDCPVEAFAGLHDPLVPLREIDAWRRHTTADWRLHRIPGGHFFTRDPRSAFFAHLSGALDRSLAAAEPTTGPAHDPILSSTPEGNRKYVSGYA